MILTEESHLHLTMSGGSIILCLTEFVFNKKHGHLKGSERHPLATNES